MKIAIITDQKPSFRMPMGIGLNRMLTKIGVESTLFFDEEISQTVYTKVEKLVIGFKNFVKKIINKVGLKKYEIIELHSNQSLLKQLSGFNAVIVVAHLPTSLSKKHFSYVEEIRSKIKLPILNYDLCFWSTRGDWCERVINEPQWGGFTGFDRFDWYLAVSNISEFPQNKNIEWPVTVVGGSFENTELYPDQNHVFKVLIDFERPKYSDERKLQLEVLNELNIPYTILEGEYDYSVLCSIYRQHSAYFLAHRESFGLPIVEVQNCGSYIFTPYKNWAPSHYINKAVSDSGEGDLSGNFIVYDNQKDKLAKELMRIKNEFNASVVIETFTASHPHLRCGDLEKLKLVSSMIKDGRINSLTHLDNKGIGKYIIK
ncbi:MAG: hypothetical protein EOO43_17280, partial [Flavobacterium sp.]